MNILVKHHPFQRRPDSFYFSAWRSVGALAAELGPDRGHYKLFINNEPVGLEHYDRILREEDEVLVCGVPGDPFSWAAFFTYLAISIALSAVTIGVTLLLRPKTNLSGPDKEKNFITGFGNTVSPYGVIPKVVGRVRPYPVFPGKYPTQYTEVIGDQQYIRGYFLVSKGPTAISQIRLGETDIDKLQDVQVEIFTGEAGDPPNTLYTRDVQEEELNVQLTQAASWQTQTTGIGPDIISVDWTFPRGLQKLTKNGGRDDRTIDVEIEYSVAGQNNWVAVGEGYTNILVTLYGPGTGQAPVLLYTHTPINLTEGQSANFQYIYNVTGNEWRDLFYDQASLHFTAKASLTDALGNTVVVQHSLTAWGGSPYSDPQRVPHDRPVTVEVTATDRNWLNTSGVITLTVTITNPDRSFFRTTGKTTSAIRETFQWPVAQQTPAVAYDVRMRRTTGPPSTQELDDTYWTALRTIKKTTPFLEPEVAGIAVRIRASDQLNGLIDNLSCLAEGKFPVWDGAAWSEPVLTRNPAWSAAAALAGNGNHDPVPWSQINGDSFLAFADWCTSKGFECNFVFDGEGNAEDACNFILATGRGSLDNVDGQYVVVIEQPQTVISNTYTPFNSWDFEGTATFPEEVHAKRIGFLNEELDYAEDERVVYDDGYSEANATKIQFVEMQGVTHKDQIWKLGRYEMADEQLQFERFSFSADWERLKTVRGDLITYSHDAMLVAIGWGLTTKHEFWPEGGKSITLDTKVILDPAKTYGVQIRLATTGEVLESQIINTGFETNYLVFPGPLPGLPLQVGHLVTVGEWGQISQRCLVKDVKSLADNGHTAARFTCAVEAPGRYTADEAEIPDHAPIITVSAHPLNLRPPFPRIRAIRSDQGVSAMQDDGAFSPRMVVSVAFPSGFNPALVYIQAQYRIYLDPAVVPNNPHPWITTAMEDGQNGEIVIANVEVILQYEVRVRTLNKLNLSLISPWTAGSVHTVLGDTVAPDPPTSVSGQAMDRTVSIKWVNPTGEGGTGTLIDFAVVEIWRSATNDSDNAVYIGETSGQVYLDEKLTNGTTYYYWLKARDWAGNLSAFHAAQTSGLTLTPTANVVVHKAEVRLESVAMSSTATLLTLNYTSKGKKIRITARAYIDMPTNNPSDVQTTQLALRGVGDHLDTYDLALAKIGPGYPGVMTFQYDDQPPAGAVSYNLLWAGSTATVNASDLFISVEEIET